MSNPKFDDRGSLLTSCHSFNYTDYSYNNGCSGYARDPYTFIVFTVKDPTDAETLNNRKVTRQIFAYKPGNGLLLQSRMYNTSGGVSGITEETKLYRDLVQREISRLEDMPNLWKTHKYVEGPRTEIRRHRHFGGYADWEHCDFCAHVSIRNDRADNFEPLTIGASGLCIKCGNETSEGLYCDDCKGGEENFCEWCEEHVDGELTEVRDQNGNWINVCENCLDNYFIRCDDCGDYWHRDCITCVGDSTICDRCYENNYSSCEECGDSYRTEDLIYDEESEEYLCEYCYNRRQEERERERNRTCSECGCELSPAEILLSEHNGECSGERLCPDCRGERQNEQETQERASA